jgi:hypothetical protein
MQLFQHEAIGNINQSAEWSEIMSPLVRRFYQESGANPKFLERHQFEDPREAWETLEIEIQAFESLGVFASGVVSWDIRRAALYRRRPYGLCRRSDL